MDAFKKTCRTRGPGGWLCPCCGPAAGSKAKERRVARRKLKQDLQTLATEEGSS